MRLRQRLSRYFERILAAGGILAAVGCSSPALDEARAQLAPTGVLRAALIMSNPVLVARDPASGAVRGVTPELAAVLAARLGVPLRRIEYANPAAYAASPGKQEWDVSFAARDPSRAAQVDFSASYMEVDNIFLAGPSTTIAASDAVDRPGIRVAVARNNAADLFLTRQLQHATLVRGDGGPAAVLEALTGGKADLFADNAHLLLTVQGSIPGARALPGRFTVVEMAIGVPKGNAAALAFVDRFVHEAKADGLVRAAIDQAGLKGVQVAGP